MMSNHLLNCTLLFLLIITTIAAFNIKEALFGSSNPHAEAQASFGVPQVHTTESTRAGTLKNV